MIPMIQNIWKKTAGQRWLMPVLLLSGLGISFAVPQFGLFNKYIQLVMMYVGINIILTVSLNLVNGYMGEFSLAHAGFMSIGAYTAAMLTMRVLPVMDHPWLFPLAVMAGGLTAGLFSLLVSVTSFRIRGDYLAIITLAFLMIVKSVIENIDYLGGPRGLPGIRKLTTLPWTYFWVVFSVWVIRNFVYSKYGRGVLAIREDEIASELMTVNTQRVKILTFAVSAFFAGVAGALFAHVLQFISPRVFDIIKTTDILIMVYLGGIASIGGSILGAVLFTVLLELLRPSNTAAILSFLPDVIFNPVNQHFIQHLGVWRMVIMPLLLVLLMLFRPHGIMGLKEFSWFIPRLDLETGHPAAPEDKLHEPA